MDKQFCPDCGFRMRDSRICEFCSTNVKISIEYNSPEKKEEKVDTFREPIRYLQGQVTTQVIGKQPIENINATRKLSNLVNLLKIQLVLLIIIFVLLTSVFSPLGAIVIVIIILGVFVSMLQKWFITNVEQRNPTARHLLLFLNILITILSTTLSTILSIIIGWGVFPIGIIVISISAYPLYVLMDKNVKVAFKNKYKNLPNNYASYLRLDEEKKDMNFM